MSPPEDQKWFCPVYSHLFMSEIHNCSNSDEFEDPGQALLHARDVSCILFCLSRFEYKQAIPLCFSCRHDPFYVMLSTPKSTPQHKCFVSALLGQIISCVCARQISFLISLTDIGTLYPYYHSICTELLFTVFDTWKMFAKLKYNKQTFRGFQNILFYFLLLK